MRSAGNSIYLFTFHDPRPQSRGKYEKATDTCDRHYRHLFAVNKFGFGARQTYLVKGRKLILKSMVREGGDKSYTFKAREGQQLTVKLIGSDAAFILYASHPFDVESISEETQSFPGREALWYGTASLEYALSVCHRLKCWHLTARVLPQGNSKNYRI